TASQSLGEAAPSPPVTGIARGEPADSSTAWAQGGLAAVFSPGDSFDLHIEDTMAAGGFHGDRVRVTVLVQQATKSIVRPVSHGAQSANYLHLDGDLSLRCSVHAIDTSVL